MYKIFKTLSHDIGIFFNEYFIIPFLTAIAITLICIIILAVKKKKENILHYVKTFSVIFYFSELFHTTLLHRIGTKINPVSDIFGEWSIYDGETMMYINPKPILNILLFLPICFAVCYILKSFTKKTFTDKNILIVTFVISFFTSLAIELIQLIFCIGTFQLSDLAYNTLGGLIGTVIYITAKRIINKNNTG